MPKRIQNPQADTHIKKISRGGPERENPFLLHHRLSDGLRPVYSGPWPGARG